MLGIHYTIEALAGLPPLDLEIKGGGGGEIGGTPPLEFRGWSYLHSQRGHSCILTLLQKSDLIFNMGVDVMKLVFNAGMAIVV